MKSFLVLPTLLLISLLTSFTLAEDTTLIPHSTADAMKWTRTLPANSSKTISLSKIPSATPLMVDCGGGEIICNGDQSFNCVYKDAGSYEVTIANPELLQNIQGLSNANITRFQAGNATNLQSLDLSNNQLTTINQQTFSGLSQLSALGLGWNQITTLAPASFITLTNLGNLHLEANNLTTFTKDHLKGLSNLTYLALDRNNFSTLEADLFEYQTSQSFGVDLRGNCLDADTKFDNPKVNDSRKYNQSVCAVISYSPATPTTGEVIGKITLVGGNEEKRKQIDMSTITTHTRTENGTRIFDLSGIPGAWNLTKTLLVGEVTWIIKDNEPAKDDEPITDNDHTTDTEEEGEEPDTFFYTAVDSGVFTTWTYITKVGEPLFTTISRITAVDEPLSISNADYRDTTAENPADTSTPSTSTSTGTDLTTIDNTPTTTTGNDTPITPNNDTPTTTGSTTPTTPSNDVPATTNNTVSIPITNIPTGGNGGATSSFSLPPKTPSLLPSETSDNVAETLATEKMKEGITRAEMAKAIVSITPAVLRESEKCSAFSDLNQAPVPLQSSIIQSCELGLMGYWANGEDVKPAFSPNEIITRAEVATVISRTLRGETYRGTEEFWYNNHLLALEKAGIIVDGKAPLSKETRGDILEILKRIVH